MDQHSGQVLESVGKVFKQVSDFVGSALSNLDRYFGQVLESVGKVFKQVSDFVGSALSNFSVPVDICSEVLSVSMIFAIVILAISIIVISFLIFVNAHLKRIDNSLREINEFLKFKK